ncbi:unnamed protein product [Durusdinium trenchii]|uniref:Methyltransferase n=2 Tax=Durusdinium trenchii TaxID=1381693 RepID=A0ABP0QHM5_9DINO
MVRASLAYQKVIPGQRIGRYISPDPSFQDPGDLCDVREETEVEIQNARLATEVLSWPTAGFELLQAPTRMQSFEDESEVRKAGRNEIPAVPCNSPWFPYRSSRSAPKFQTNTGSRKVYYSEVQSLLSEVLEKAGAKVERVMVFDHTIRSSTASGLNTLGVRGKWAGPATFVHADYNERSAPQRLQQLAQTPGYTGVLLPAEDVQKVLSSGQRFAFINVWRSIDPLNPAFDYPLSLCDPRSVEEEDWMNYEMVYPDRVGSRLSLSNRAAASHKWYYYPEMRIDECLIFSCYDRRPDVPRFVFHSAFDDPSARTKIPRQSIEARTAVIFDELALKSTI